MSTGPLPEELHLAWEFRPDGGEFQPIPVPGPWQAALPDFHGKGEYRAAFTRRDRDPVVLLFEAVATEARVLVNGCEAGRHLGAWTPFAVDATPHLHADPGAANEIRVEVDEKPDHTTSGFHVAIGAGFGGIWGRVLRLKALPANERPAPLDPGIRVQGARILLHGRPLHVRGILHWGYYPEHKTPTPSRSEIEAEVAGIKALGFNLVKFCLFVPPERYLDVCDEAGLWVWQEYPVWNRPLRDPAVLYEFEEFLRRDCRHPSVIIRTFTCENDHVDPALAARLYAVAKDYAPNTLVLDNSAWLCAERVGDFHDEHPYLHNLEWRSYGERTRRALADRTVKPLLLGETMGVDTWNDLKNVRPRYLESQQAIESEVATAGVLERSLRTANRVRKHQIERLMLDLPGTGYVITAIRDIRQPPLGFCTEDGRPKFAPKDWAWHGDTMILADLDDRSFFGGSWAEVDVSVSHFGPETCRGTLRSTFNGYEQRAALTVEPGQVKKAAGLRLAIPEVDRPRAFPLEVAFAGRTNAWNLWAVPRAGRAAALPVVETLDPAATRAIAAGAAAIHVARPRQGRWKCPTYTWWSPVAWFRPGLFPEDLLEELIVHDLLSGRVLAAAPGLESLVEVFDMHMEDGKVMRRPLVAATRIGAGKLLVSALRHDSPAGAFLLEEFAALLPGLDPPRLSELPAADSVFPQGFVMWNNDPRPVPVAVEPGVGIACEGWRTFEAGFTIPEAWHDQEVQLFCEAVGDAFVVRIDDSEIGRAGNIDGTWDGTRDKPRAFPVRLAAGTHRLAVDSRDWRGAGCLKGPIFFTRTPSAMIY